jgi:hypothetical protein
VSIIGKIVDWFDCWRGDHDWYTETRSDGVLLRTELCSACGSPHPQAFQALDYSRPADPVGEDPECE